MAFQEVISNGATQNSGRHARIFSHIAQLFDCREVMDVDEGQPGELPLMKELAAVNGARQLKYPSTVPASWGVPALLNPSWRSWKSVFKESTGKIPRADRVHASGDFVNWRFTGSTSRRGVVSRNSLWSESISDTDRGDEEINTTDIEDARNCQQKHTKHLQSEKVFLYNWTKPNWRGDTEGVAIAKALQNEERIQYVDKRTNASTRRVLPRCNSVSVYEAQKCLQKGQNNPSKNKRLCKQNAQILSPLLLSSLDGQDYAGHPLPLFTLEGHLAKENKMNNRAIARQKRARPSLSLSSLPVKQEAGSGLGKCVRCRHKSTYVLTLSANSSQRRVSQGSIQGSWGDVSSGLDNPVNVYGLSGHRCSMPCYWSKSKKRGKSLFHIAGRSLSCGFSTSSQTNGHATLLKYYSKSRTGVPGYAHDGQAEQLDLDSVEALPLLTASSQSTDGRRTSSVDGTERQSSDLNGELEVNWRCAMNAQMNGASESVVHDKARIGISLGDGEKQENSFGKPRNLSQKYRPRVFEELVGQSHVAHTLSNAILRGTIAPIYLFQGSRGTGKTSAARIFAAALNCVTSEEQRPCGVCNKCVALASGKSTDVREVDAASNNGIERVKKLLQSTISAPQSGYIVFIIDECHVLTKETWNTLLKLLEQPPANIVFILITTEPDKLPSTTITRCQKVSFQKVRNSEIVTRLQSLAKLENLDAELGALDLIASRSDGSLRDAETLLDQLSLLGQKITKSTFHKLVGSASDEKLLGLLALALSSDIVSTVQKVRELIDSGIQPLDLKSQLATLIENILAGCYEFEDSTQKGSLFSKNALSEEELERLQISLGTFSEVERQLKAASNDGAAWLTAALLQLGPDRPFDFGVSSSRTSVISSPITQTNPNDKQILESKKVNSKIKNRKQSTMTNTIYYSHKKINASTNRLINSSCNVQVHPIDQSFSHGDVSKELSHEVLLADSSLAKEGKENNVSLSVSPDHLDRIWCHVLEGCKSIPLRKLLHSHGKLLSVSSTAVDAVVHLEFVNPESKCRAERLKKSIANAFRKVLGLSVEVQIVLASLPAGADILGSRKRSMVIDQQKDIMQGGLKQFTNTDARAGCRPQTEDSNLEVSSLHHWRSQGRVSFPNRVEQIRSPHSLPTIPPCPDGSVPDPPAVARSPSKVFGGNIQSNQRAENGLPEEKNLKSAWISEGRKLYMLQASDNGDINIGSKIASDPKTEDTNMSMASCKTPSHELHTAQLMSEYKIHTNFQCGDCDETPHNYDLEKKNLRLESGSKYWGLACWKAPNMHKRVTKQHYWRQKGFVIRLMPCMKFKSQ